MRKKRQRAKSEMNVVPYIDVMLVLLVIFMISAPLLNQSVEVDLPQNSEAQPLPDEDNMPLPLVVHINAAGEFYMDQIADSARPVSLEEMAQTTREILSKTPETLVYLRADKGIDYGQVMAVMAVLQQNGAPRVGLVTESTEAVENTESASPTENTE